MIQHVILMITIKDVNKFKIKNMNKLKSLSIAFLLAVALTNLKIANNQDNNVSFDLSQLVANAQTNTTEINGIKRIKIKRTVSDHTTGEFIEGSWYEGSKMIDVQKNSGGHKYVKIKKGTEDKTGVELSTSEITLSGSGTILTDSEGFMQYDFIVIQCCINTNDNTTCRFEGQSKEC
mgnify:CR=1 FL=1